MANKQDDQSVVVAEPKTRVKPSTRPQPRTLPLFNVVLLDDDDHSYDYVIEMLGIVFTHPVERAFQMAKEVDKSGRVVVMTAHKELAELKRDQILGYGADPRLGRSRGSMAAIIEPADH